MLVKNASVRLISIGGVCIAPNGKGNIDDVYSNHPVVKKYLKSKELIKIEAIVAYEEVDEDNDFAKMNKEQLCAYAAENNIDLTGTKTKADILAVIVAAIEKATEEADKKADEEEKPNEE